MHATFITTLHVRLWDHFIEISLNAKDEDRLAFFRSGRLMQIFLDSAELDASNQFMSDAKRHLLSKTRVLFVDDEETIRQNIAGILGQHGFDVTVAATVPEALDIINHQKFDILLTDLNIGNPADGRFPSPAAAKLNG